MTPPVNDPETLHRIFANAEALLLDFDGPICSVFAGFPASVVADQLRGVLSEGGGTSLPSSVRAADDPFEVLLYAAKLGRDEARHVEAAFRAHEVEAVQSAVSTRYSVELIHAWRETSRPIAIVSNNSAASIDVYLDICGLRSDIETVSARTSAEVSLLKPSPFLLLEAAVKLKLSVAQCVLIDDSVTDIQASRAANVAVIGYANKPGKRHDLAAVGPDAIVSDLAVVVRSLDPGCCN